jgi:hypothetical protein
MQRQEKKNNVLHLNNNQLFHIQVQSAGSSNSSKFLVAHNNATHNKPLLDRKFVRQCLVDVAEMVCSENKSL